MKSGKRAQLKLKEGFKGFESVQRRVLQCGLQHLLSHKPLLILTNVRYGKGKSKVKIQMKYRNGKLLLHTLTNVIVQTTC